MGHLKTKRHIFFISLALLIFVAAIMTIWSLFFMPKDYEDIIPAQSKAVISIDVLPQNSVTHSLQRLAQQAGLPINGLDVSRPVYLLITPNEYYALCAPVADAEAVRTTMEDLVPQRKVSDVQEEGGVTYAWLQKGWQIAWTRKALAIVGPGTPQERSDLRQTLRRMFKSGRKQSFRHGESFRKFRDLNGNVRLFARPNALPVPLNLLLRLALPLDADLSRVALYASLQETTDSDLLRLKGRFSADDATTQATLNAFFKQELPATRTTPPAENADALLRLTTYISEGNLLRLLRTNPQTRAALTALDETIDASAMLATVSGPAEFEVTAFSADFSPTFSFVAQTNGDDLMQNADSWQAATKKQKDVSLVREGAGYLLTSKGHALHFGQQDGTLYFRSTTASLVPASVQTIGITPGSRLIAHLNLQKLYQQPCVPKSIATTLQSIFNNAKQLCLNCHVDGSVELEIQ